MFPAFLRRVWSCQRHDGEGGNCVPQRDGEDKSISAVAVEGTDFLRPWPSPDLESRPPTRLSFSLDWNLTRAGPQSRRVVERYAMTLHVPTSMPA